MMEVMFLKIKYYYIQAFVFASSFHKIIHLFHKNFYWIM